MREGVNGQVARGKVFHPGLFRDGCKDVGVEGVRARCDGIGIYRNVGLGNMES